MYFLCKYLLSKPDLTVKYVQLFFQYLLNLNFIFFNVQCD